MNEWEKKQAEDASQYFASINNKDYIVKYETASYYWNAIEKKSKWWVFKNNIKKLLVAIFITPFVNFKNNVAMYIACNRKCNEVDIEQLEHELKISRDRILSLEFANKHLIDHANKAWDTLAAYRKLDADAAEEQAQKKKAAKKRPSSKKKRKG